MTPSRWARTPVPGYFRISGRGSRAGVAGQAKLAIVPRPAPGPTHRRCHRPAATCAAGLISMPFWSMLMLEFEACRSTTGHDYQGCTPLLTSTEARVSEGPASRTETNGNDQAQRPHPVQRLIRRHYDCSGDRPRRSRATSPRRRPARPLPAATRRVIPRQGRSGSIALRPLRGIVGAGCVSGGFVSEFARRYWRTLWGTRVKLDLVYLGAERVRPPTPTLSAVLHLRSPACKFPDLFAQVTGPSHRSSTGKPRQRPRQIAMVCRQVRALRVASSAGSKNR